MARTEFYDDPDAPGPNSRVVAASAVVTEDRERILLQRRTDSGLWALPGGGMEMSDSLPGTAVREVGEETGLESRSPAWWVPTPTPATSSPTATARCAGVNVCFAARVTGGELAIPDESTELAFVGAEELDGLDMYYTQRLRLQHHLERRRRSLSGVAVRESDF